MIPWIQACFPSITAFLAGNCPQRSSFPFCFNACTSQMPFSAPCAPSLAFPCSSGSVLEPRFFLQGSSPPPHHFSQAISVYSKLAGEPLPQVLQGEDVQLCVSGVWIRIVQNLGHPRLSPKHHLPEAKRSFWITHSVVITLREGLRAGSALSCQAALSSDLRPSLLNHWVPFAAWLQGGTWLGYPRKTPQGLHTVDQQCRVGGQESTISLQQFCELLGHFSQLLQIWNWIVALPHFGSVGFFRGG